MTASLHQLTVHCPQCKGYGKVRLPFGGTPSCPFCQGYGAVYAAEGLAAAVRREKARSIVEATMREFRRRT